MLKRFLSYYKPHMKIFIMDMIASLLVALIAIVYPIMTREMLSRVEIGFGGGGNLSTSIKFVIILGVGYPYHEQQRLRVMSYHHELYRLGKNHRALAKAAFHAA